jgi:hypothetical protein
MKKLLGFFLIILFFIGLIFTTSCKPADNRPDCEIYNYGTVTVINKTGWSLWVDVTTGNSDNNHERRVPSGGFTTYNNISSGSIRIWASYDRVNWVYDNKFLAKCITYNYTWTPGKKAMELSIEGESSNKNDLR